MNSHNAQVLDCSFTFPIQKVISIDYQIVVGFWVQILQNRTFSSPYPKCRTPHISIVNLGVSAIAQQSLFPWFQMIFQS